MIVMEAYPKQALWMFMAVVKSTKPQREQRGKQILEKLKVNLNYLQCVSLTYRFPEHPAQR